MASAYPVRSSQPEVRYEVIRLLGANGAAPTVEEGVGVTATRAGEGSYAITWSQDPGRFLGWSASFGAATPGNIAGYTAVRDTFDVTNKKLPFIVYSNPDAGTGGAPTAADIIASEYIDIVVAFAKTGA